jgi:mono/diheme cytochrome c family protein
MRSHRRTSLVAAAAAVSLAGCGGSHGDRRPESQADVTSGRVVFAQACSACHTLTGRYDPRRQGGDLLAFHASRAQLVQLTGEMPVRHPLRQSQLDAVVRFVMAAESRHG